MSWLVKDLQSGLMHCMTRNKIKYKMIFAQKFKSVFIFINCPGWLNKNNGGGKVRKNL